VAELHGQGQAGKGIQKPGQVAAVVWIAPEKGRQLHQHGQQLARLHQRGDAFPVPVGLGRPIAGVHFVGQGAGQLGGKSKVFRHPAAHAVHGRCFGHLVPGVVDLADREDTGVVDQHPGRAGSRRVKTGVHPLAVGVSAGPDQDSGRILSLLTLHGRCFSISRYHYLYWDQVLSVMV
jgi:hypothetical protein